MSRRFLALIAGLMITVFSLTAQPEFTISSATADNGQMVEIDVVIDDYIDLISLQFSMNWDPGVLTFQDVINVTDGLPGFNASSSINADVANGNLTVSWFEASLTPVTLPNGTNLYTLQFLVIGDPCDVSDVVISGTPLAIEIADADENNVGADVNNGSVMIPGTDCGQFNGLRITGSQEISSNGQQVCVQFTSEGFSDIGGAQYTINFNPAVIAYTGVQNINWPGVSEAGSFGTTNAASGELTFVWFDQNAVGVDLPDGTVLYELCFDVVGSGGQMSQITFVDTPLEIEISDGDGMIVDFEGVPGKVTVEGDLEGFALISESVMGAPEETVCVEISVNDFDEILSMQFSINWDSTVLMYDHVEGFNLPDFNEGNVTGPEAPGNNSGQMTVVWFDQTINGVTVANGTSIFSVCFKIIGGCDESSLVEFSSEPLDIEVSNLTEVLDVSQSVGTVSVVCGGCGNSVEMTHPCPGECNGSIDIDVFGCSAPISFVWSNSETTEDLTNLCAGDYTVTITTGDGIIISDVITLAEADPVSVSANITDVVDGGDGAVMITVSGGTEPFTYLWDDPGMSETKDITGLDAGQYSVTITDSNGCVFTAGPFEVRDGAAIAGAVTNVACFGESTGAIDLTVGDCGTAPHMFAWSNDATTEDISGLPAGMYTVTVTNTEGTTCEATFTVQQSGSAIVVEVDTMNETSAGNNGAIDLTVTGGQGPYTYLWDNDATTQDLTNLSAGAYTVTITDQFGCEVVETIAIRGNALFVDLLISEFNGFGTSCAGVCDGEIIADPSNQVGAVTYAWSNSATSQSVTELCAGSFSVTVTDELGQTAVATVEITEPLALSVEVDVTCASEPGASDGAATAIVSGGIAPYAFQWGTGATSPSIQNQSPGSVVLFVTDDNNCENMQQIDICIDGIPCYTAISTITPNGDGKNDRFVMSCLFDFPNRLSMFNRYGGLEFRMENYNNSWEGTDQDGNVLSDGGYLWVLEVFLPNGQDRIYRGTVAIVRSLD